MISFPAAKINLGLHVVEQRADGFHNIETVFYPIGICDALEVVPSQKEGIEFTSSGLPIAGDTNDNLIVKAINLLSSSIRHPASSIQHPASSIQHPASSIRHPASGIQHPASSIQVHLHKVIPMGAGLGGGSADGAYTLKMLNDLWRLDLSVRQLQDLARQLGSDCAFFIENKPAFATGKGDQFEPIDLDLSSNQIVVVVPPVHMSTLEAYSMVKPRKPVQSIREIIRLPIEQWKSRLINDFEEPVMKRYPVIREIKEELYNQGAIYAAMSGSGAAVFGVFSPQSPVRSPALAGSPLRSDLQFDPSFFKAIV